MPADRFWDGPDPEPPYPDDCYVCARFAQVIRIRKKENNESWIGWEHSRRTHVSLSHR